MCGCILKRLILFLASATRTGRKKKETKRDYGIIGVAELIYILSLLCALFGDAWAGPRVVVVVVGGGGGGGGAL